MPISARILAVTHAQRQSTLELEDGYPWVLLEVSTTLADSRFKHFASSYAGVSVSNAEGRSPAAPLLEQWFSRWMQDAEKAGARYWLADETLNDEGELIFDQLLGIHLPENYNPVDVIEIELHGASTSQAPSHWYDICPIGTQTEALLVGTTRTGYSSRSHGCMTSPEKARDYIQKQAIANGFATHAVTVVPDAAPVPQGVERWFIVQNQHGRENNDN